jgi:hypothetical protein
MYEAYLLFFQKIIVKELLAKIDRDNRHHNIVILAETDKEKKNI